MTRSPAQTAFIFLIGILLAACSTGKWSADPLQQAKTGYLLVDLNANRALEEEKAGQTFIPASTTKLLTAAAALNVLGPDYRFTTELIINGPIKDGTLQGDLILWGWGDPLLDTQHLLNMASTLKKKGISSITGHFYYHDKVLPNLTAIDVTQPADAPYNPGVSALSHDFNRFRVDWDGDRIQIMPPIETLDVTFQFRRYPQIGSGWGKNKEVWTIADHQKRPDSGTVWLPIRRPALQTAMVFREVADLIGVTLPRPEDPGAKGFGAPRVLIVHESVPLTEVVRQGLEYSNNMVAELTGMMTAKMLVKDITSVRRTSDVITDWLKEQNPEEDWQGLNLPNHSGLSSKARITPRQAIGILKSFLKQGNDKVEPMALLPASGWIDHHGERWRDPAIAMRVMAKSGTMNYARGLVGVIITKKGRKLGFAIYTTDFNARHKYDAKRHREYGEDTSLEDAWRDAAKDREVKILKKWAEKY